MLKSGYIGSGLSDIVWMGDVVNDASNLCHQGNKNGQLPVQVATIVYQNLDAYPQSLLSPVYKTCLPIQITHYQGDLIHKGMQNWLDNKKAVASKNSLAALILLGGEIPKPAQSSINSSQNMLASVLYSSAKK